MRCHHIRQGFLQDVVRARLRQQLVHVERAQGGHAAHAGALRRGHACGMNAREQLCRAEARREECLHGAHDVPQRHTVEVVDHVGRDAIDRRVESGRHLAADEARHCHAARHTHWRAGRAGNLPFLTIEVRRSALNFFYEGLGGCFIVHGEGQRLLQVDGGQFRREVVHHRHVRAEVIVVAAHADVGHHLVMELFVDVFLGNGFAGLQHGPLGRLGIPLDEAHGPGQLKHAGSGKLAGKLDLEAGTRGTQRAELTCADDDDHVIERLRHATEVWRGPLQRGQRVRQCLHRLRGLDDAAIGCACLLRPPCGLAGQFRQLEVGLAQTAGEVKGDRVLGRLLTHVGVGAAVDQLDSHFLGGVGFHALSLDKLDHWVVSAHQASATYPTDEGVDQRGALAPDRLCLPAGNQGVECRLGLTIGAVATEAATVRATWQHHVQALAHVGIRAQLRQARDELLHRPQQQTHLRLGLGAGVGQRALHARSSEREEQGRHQRRLDQLGLAAHCGRLLVSNPLHQGVEIFEGAQVRRDHPQRGGTSGVRAVELLVELHAVMV